jgi:hypothetical protein
VDAEVLRDDGTLHGREVELALAREALTIEAVKQNMSTS